MAFDLAHPAIIQLKKLEKLRSSNAGIQNTCLAGGI